MAFTNRERLAELTNEQYALAVVDAIHEIEFQLTKDGMSGDDVYDLTANKFEEWLTGVPKKRYEPHPIEERHASVAMQLECGILAVDCDGVRWAKCTRCGYQGPATSFARYGGVGKTVNDGICINCARK